MIKHKLLSIFLLTAITAILSVALVSAAVDYVHPITGDELSNLSSSGDPGTQVAIQFKLENDVSTTAKEITLTLPELVTSSGKKIPTSSLSLSTVPAEISGNSESNTITLTVNIPAGQSASTYTGSLDGSGKYTSSINFDIPISITVNSKPSLNIPNVVVITPDSNANITVKNTGNTDLSSISLVVPEISGARFTLPSPITNIEQNKQANAFVGITYPAGTNLRIGNNNALITATAGDGTKGTGTLTIQRTFCRDGEKGTDLEITDVTIDNNDGDDEEWGPLDEVEIDVEVTNDGNEKIKDVVVEIGLFNSRGKNVINDMDNLDNDEISLGSIKDDKDDTAKFTFNIPADFESDNYRFVVKAYSDDIKEENLCTSRSSDLDNDFFQTIDGIREEDTEKHIIFHNIKVTPTPAQCNEIVQVTGTLVNIGDDEYEDQVRVTMFNSELGINQEEIVREDFKEGDEEVVDFEFTVPRDATEKLYNLEFRTYYDYDDKNEDYDEVSEDKFFAGIRVEGSCVGSPTTGTGDLDIDAELDSETPEAVAGSQLVINARLRNTGNEETLYTVSVTGNTAWSRVVSIDPQVLTLGPGESDEVSIALLVDDDAEGDNELTIRVSFSGKSEQQKVSVFVEPKAGQQAQQLGPVVSHIRDNWFIYLIILVNIILIIAIILVIRSMVSPTGPAL